MVFVAVLFLLFASPAIAQVQSLTQGPDETIWVARSHQLLKMGAVPQIVTWYKGSSPIRAILAGANGKDLWIGAEEGLFRCKQNNCRLDSRIPAAPILALAQSHQDLWIATSEKLYQIRNNTITSAALPSNRIESIAVNKDGSVWVGTRTSVQLFRNGSFEEVLKGSAQAISVEPATGVVWIGAGHELIRRDNGGSKTFSLPPPPANVRMRPPITSILPALSGKTYLGTHGGLFQLTDGSLRKVLEEEVFSLLRDRNGTIWIGTSDGLKKIVNGKTMDVPLPDRS